MHKLVLFYFLVFVGYTSCTLSEKGSPPVPPFLTSNGNQTPTYEEGMQFWTDFAKFYQEVDLQEIGTTDAGLPLHVVIIDLDRPRKVEGYELRQKQLLLINNAIHPGEPDGVDASMLMASELLEDSNFHKRMKNTVVVIIPFYNIGGTLNRNTNSRANQNGPEEYGFRGNAQNLDLNRDFIKMDSKNARSFAELITLIDPDLYIETHVSNGADYTYVMTYLTTQEDKMGGRLKDSLRKSYTPFLIKEMGKRGYPMSPYVNVHGTSPEEGFATFYDQPRYSTGFLALKQIPGYITETHMLKPYKERVLATKAFLETGIRLMNRSDVASVKKIDRESVQKQDSFALDWALDESSVQAFHFAGYHAEYKPSEVTGEMRLWYNKEKLIENKISYYPNLKPTKWAASPSYYVLKRGFVDVEDRLKSNGVEMTEFQRDTTILLIIFKVDTFSTSSKPYEKHYVHSKSRFTLSKKEILIHKGDYLIPANNVNKRFLLEVLHPEAPDSYFNWNFFDAILQQKEWYSDYVFEDEAAERLRSDED
ncbi:MAG: hypothetical protein ACI83I_002537, partial [Bacteroidia bacterium]